MGIKSLFPVYHITCLVHIPELLEHPFHERLASSDIDRVIEDDQRTMLMLLEFALQLSFDALQVLFPLSWEELQLLGEHGTSEFGLDFLQSSQALVKRLIVDNSCK